MRPPRVRAPRVQAPRVRPPPHALPPPYGPPTPIRPALLVFEPGEPGGASGHVDATAGLLAANAREPRQQPRQQPRPLPCLHYAVKSLGERRCGRLRGPGGRLGRMSDVYGWQGATELRPWSLPCDVFGWRGRERPSGARSPHAHSLTPSVSVPRASEIRCVQDFPMRASPSMRHRGPTT